MSKFSNYLKALSQVNDLEKGFKVIWLFHCGMLFSSRQKWWGNFKFRQSVHEGVDITYYRRYPDEIRQFDSAIKVPAVDKGVILNICDDFIGRTLVIEYKNSNRFNNKILFAYAHILPETDLKPGMPVLKNEIIAKICPIAKNPELPPHLHFSCFEVSRTIPDKNLDWKLFSKNNHIHKVHPFFL